MEKRDLIIVSFTYSSVAIWIVFARASAGPPFTFLYTNIQWAPHHFFKEKTFPNLFLFTYKNWLSTYAWV